MPELLTQMMAAPEITARPASASPAEVWSEAYETVRHPSVAWAAPEAVVVPGHPLAPVKAQAPRPEDRLWSGSRVRVAQARSLLAADAEAAWIGHADTG